MRLTEEQHSTINRLVGDTFGTPVRVLLFGSRVDDNTMGGDVDLLVETASQHPLASELSLEAKLEQQLGEPVDLITTLAGQKGKPIVEIARLTGVEL